MSATSKLVGFSATAEDQGDYAAKQADTDRRRYLMRYVVGALGVAGVICVAAGIRVTLARSATAHEEASPHFGSPVVAAPPATPEPVQARVEPAATAAPVVEPVAPVTAAAPVAPSKVEPSAAQAKVEPSPAHAEAPKHAAPVAAPARAPVAATPAPASHSKVQAHAAGIVHAAPF